MSRHEQFRSELAAGVEAQKNKANLDGDVVLSVWTEDKTSVWWSTAAATRICFKELKEDVPSCRSREAAATARISLLRELASAWNSAGLDLAPSYSRGRDETSCTGPNVPLELAQPDFACSASDKTKKLESTFELHGEMDEFRRLKVMYPTASARERTEF